MLRISKKDALMWFRFFAGLPEEEMRGAKAVLRAAALTYVASALQAVLQLLRLVALANSRRRDD